ncbi:MAG: hypothetical protein IPJ27_19590 [Candidatus Accumulibacter sp.]|uniref:Uncharacterized protein n=1 Tax=Candidatus Accumulibacter proximus TaxID=2954385 RepID=A0A935Q3C9_9PROT|nr:hypothetical protein [Candidatus Accumulibacter proximus]
MKQDLISLAIERGRLLERISNQRQLLGQQLQPVGDALETADRAIATVRKAGTYLGQHPEVVAAGVAVLVVLAARPRLALEQARLLCLAYLAPAAPKYVGTQSHPCPS